MSRRRALLDAKRKYLYREGDECVNITGGWEFPSSLNRPSLANSFDCNENGAASITREKEANGVALSGYAKSGWASVASVHTVRKIDFAGYSKLVAVFSRTISPVFAKATGEILLQVQATLPDGITTANGVLAQTGIETTPTEAEIGVDVTALDSGYVVFYINTYSRSYKSAMKWYTHSVRLREIFME